MIKVGGTEVRLIKASKKKPTCGEKTIRHGAVVVPTDNYDPEEFPAVERLRRSLREIFPDGPDEGGEA